MTYPQTQLQYYLEIYQLTPLSYLEPSTIYSYQAFWNVQVT